MVNGCIFGGRVESAPIIRFSTRRKTLAIKFQEGRVTVYAPAGTPQSKVMAYINHAQPWINKQSASYQQQQKEIAHKTYTPDGQFFYLGRVYTLAQLLAEDRVFSQDLKSQLFTWYQQQAQRILTLKTSVMAGQIKQSYQAIQLGYYRSKWGSCNHKRVLRYHWPIIQAPEAVVDYLVAHEVSHLKHMNHSQSFWQQVATLCPDYQTQRKWLREHGHRLRFL